MKQIIIGGNVAYATGVDYKDLTQVPKGAIALFDLSDGTLINTAITCGCVGHNFAVVCGRGENKMPLHFPEVDVKSLTVSKATYQEGKKFSASITVPTTEKGKEYTVIIAKTGVVFNERNKWSFDAVAKSDVAADVAAEIVKKINANGNTLGVTAENVGGKITITGVEEGADFEVLGADSLMGEELTDVTHGLKAILDKAYVQDLASRCAAGKGFNYTDEAEIYPGYPEEVADTQYTMFTLRFAVPRVSAKQRDEVVYQTLHIVVPSESSAVTTLDTVLGTCNGASADAASITDEEETDNE